MPTSVSSELKRLSNGGVGVSASPGGDSPLGTSSFDASRGSDEGSVDKVRLVGRSLGNVSSELDSGKEECGGCGGPGPEGGGCMLGGSAGGTAPTRAIGLDGRFSSRLCS